MSQRERRSSLDKLSASALSMGALSIPSLKKKKTALVALGAVLLVGCFLIVYNRAEYYNWRSHDALYASRLEACEEGVREGKVSFWLKNMRDDDYVCQMYAETYREMVGDVGHGVPKIIHQSWKSVDVPDKFRVWLSSWREANPDYEYWFWTDVENREMVETYYPQFLETYDAFSVNIMRADFVRALYMHQYGGVYADLDTWCLRPVDSLLSPGSRKAYVAEMGPDLKFPHNIPNAWFGSAPNHPFWIFFSKCIVEMTTTLRSQGWWLQAEQVTGPIILKQAVDAWNSIHGAPSGDPTLEVIKHGKVYVDDWHGNGNHPEIQKHNARFREACPSKELYKKDVEEQCKAAFPDAVVLTFWTHSWGR